MLGEENFEAEEDEDSRFFDQTNLPSIFYCTSSPGGTMKQHDS